MAFRLAGETLSVWMDTGTSRILDCCDWLLDVAALAFRSRLSAISAIPRVLAGRLEQPYFLLTSPRVSSGLAMPIHPILPLLFVVPKCVLRKPVRSTAPSARLTELVSAQS